MKPRAAPAGEDLEALFDSIAAATAEKAAVAPAATPIAKAPSPPPPAKPAPPPAARAVKSAAPAPSSAPAAEDDLEALFDQVAAQREAAVAEVEATAEKTPAAPAPAPAAAAAADGTSEERMFQRLGALTRTLHDALRELGYDKKLERAATSLPDARDRLAYIASLTGKSADTVLSAVEHGQSLQQAIDADAMRLAQRWDQLYAREIGVEDFKLLAVETRSFLGGMTQRTTVMQGHLHQIMMAQDFHDLTGQVIVKVVDVAHMLETSLLTLLVETSAVIDPRHEPMLTGPQVRPEMRTDVVTSQEQVDDLLGSLGF